MSSFPFRSLSAAIGLCLAGVSSPSLAQTNEAQQSAMGVGPSFADVAELADSAGMVVHVKVRKVARVDAARAPGLQPGYGRFYIEAQTVALLVGHAGIGPEVAYLVDLPLDSRGRGPDLKKRDVIVFARAVPGRPGELQLVSPGAQEFWTPELDARVRGILQALVSPNAPAKITGVSELMYVPGNLAGQGETQIFLKTQSGTAASITVRHSPGAPPVWGVSFSELVADLGHPPLPETLEWYRLACFLPHTLPDGVNVSDGADAMAQGQADYQFVLQQLGPCRHTLR